jgi:hypothetical protein
MEQRNWFHAEGNGGERTGKCGCDHEIFEGVLPAFFLED